MAPADSMTLVTSDAPGKAGRATPAQPFTLTWSCTRRPRGVGGDATRLERVRLVLIVEPVDHERARIEAWVDSPDARARFVRTATTGRCAIAATAGLLNLDVFEPDGRRLLAMSLDIESQRLAYAQTPLLRDVGFVGGTYDPPAMLASAAVQMVQSA